MKNMTPQEVRSEISLMQSDTSKEWFLEYMEMAVTPLSRAYCCTFRIEKNEKGEFMYPQTEGVHPLAKQLVRQASELLVAAIKLQREQG